MNTKTFAILLLMLCITGCNNHRTKQYAQHKMRQVQKQETEKIIVPKDTCWIRIEDKKFFIGEDLDSVKKTILMHQSPVGDWGKDYETFLDDIKLKKIALSRLIGWRFENKKLASLRYGVTTTDIYLSDRENNNFSEKNYREYYQYINNVEKDNPCIYKVESGNDSSAYKRSMHFVWK